MKNRKKPKSLLIENADYLVTMDKNRRILRNASVYIEGPEIKEVDSKRKKADKAINASGMIVLPGFINCHHHMFQCAFRGMPKLQNQKISKWISIICNGVKQMDEEMIYFSSLANMAELLLYGCTTTTDMLYMFPRKKKNFFEITIKAAKDIGIRFHPYYGSMSLSQKDGAFFSDDVVQNSKTILLKSESLIKKFHNTDLFSMIKVGLAPCAIFTNSKEDYLNAVKLAKKYKVNLQTHVGESEYENSYSVEKFKKRPVYYLQSLGWKGKIVSFTHCINITDKEIKKIAQTKTNVVHCPVSNARKPIGEIGVAPIWKMIKNGVNVAIGVDGSAGNDSSNVLEELRWARILQGTQRKSTYLKPMDVLEMGTVNGAKLLNWENEIGSLEQNKAADIAIFNTRNKIEHAGAVCDPVSSLIASQAVPAEYVIINGKVVVEKERLKTFSLKEIIKKENKNAKKII